MILKCYLIVLFNRYINRYNGGFIIPNTDTLYYNTETLYTTR